MSSMALERNQGRSSLEDLYLAAAPRVYGLVLDRCGSAALAEDVTAQTFEAAARHVARGRGDEVVLPWLFTVAKRRLIDHWRRESTAARVRERIGLEGSLPASRAEAPDQDPDITEALDALPSRQRAVLCLRYMDDWSVSEIATGLDLSYQAAESLLARARRSFRDAVAERGGPIR